MALNPGDIVDDKYRIVRLLGEGGMGAVYEAENARIARRVAIKVLLGDAANKPDVVMRFEREAQAAGRIGSDHILEILDFGNLPSGDRFMVMEYLDGEELSTRLKRGPLSPQACVPLFRQLLQGLEAAHTAGIVHRDLKPDNVFILKEKAGLPDFVKIIDFGISKFNQLNDTDHEMTKTGALLGTPYYLSPEQARGAARSDPRSDVYSCGVILYQCVTGTVPFDAETLNELLFAIVLSPPKPLGQVAPQIDPAFAAIVEKAMAREMHERFQSATELKDALDAWLAGAPLQIVAPTAGVPEGAGNGIPADASGPHPAAMGTPMGGQVPAGMHPPPNLPVETRNTWSQSQSDVIPQPPTSKTGLWVGLGLGALLLGGIAVAGVGFLLTRGGDDPVAAGESGESAVQADAGETAPPTADAEAPSVTAEVQADAGAEGDEVAEADAQAPEAETPDVEPADPKKPVAAAPKPAPKPFVKPGPKPVRPPAPKPAATPKPGKPDFGY